MAYNDIVEIPGYPGRWALRFVVERWIAAGRPRINDAGRTYQQQLDARLKYERGQGAPADDPRYPNLYRLAHPRGFALDIAYTDAIVRNMLAAGFYRPYSYEPWHFEPTGYNIYNFPIIRDPWAAILAGTQNPAPAPEPPKEEPEMIIVRIKLFDGSQHICGVGNGLFSHFLQEDREDIHRDMLRQPRIYDFGIDYLARLLRIYGCDPHIWDVRDGKFVVLDPLTGSVAPGATWSSDRAIRAAIAGIKIPQLDLAVLVDRVSEAIAKAIKENPLSVDVDETAIAAQVIDGLPASASSDEIANKVADVISARLA